MSDKDIGERLLASSVGNDCEELKYCLYNGGELGTKLYYYLYQAIKFNSIEYFKILVDDSIRKGVNLDFKRLVELTVEDGRLDLLSFLKGFDLDLKEIESYLMMVCARNNNLKMFKFLVQDCGLDPRVGEDLAFAVATNAYSTGIIKYLVGCGCKDDKFFKSVIKDGDIEMVRFLCSKGWVIDAKEDEINESIKEEVLSLKLSQSEKSLLNKDVTVVKGVRVKTL